MGDQFPMHDHYGMQRRQASYQRQTSSGMNSPWDSSTQANPWGSPLTSVSSEIIPKCTSFNSAYSYEYGEIAPTLSKESFFSHNSDGTFQTEKKQVMMSQRYWSSRVFMIAGFMAGVFGVLWLIGKSTLADFGMIDELITVSALLDVVAYGILLYRVFASQSGAGISVHTLVLYLAAFFSRFLSISIQGTSCYTPEHHLGEFYHIILLATAVLVLAVLWLIAGYRRDAQLDKLVGWPFIIAGFILAYFTHVECSGFWPDVFFSASHWIDGFALLPQMMLLDTRGFVERTTSYFVAAVIFSRYMSFFSWALVIVFNGMLFSSIAFTMIASYSITILASVKWVYYFVKTFEHASMRYTDSQV